ncbi:MAG: EamA family transporter [Betaproteobacteria bacterium]|nr:4-amino-4-deoxy-L-arabinose transferase [Betaproteobacteria bacterium]
MTLNTFMLILTGVMLNAGAQLLLKAGVSPLGPLSPAWNELPALVWRVLSQWPIVAGLACYVISVGVWIIGLSRVDVSLAYPLLSLGYVVNALLAWWLFGEVVNATRWGGIVLILAGVWLISRS